MISSDKHELEMLTPRDFIKYINNTFKYNFMYEKIDFPVFRINRGNPRQVFEYVLSSNKKEKLQSFVDVFSRIVECKFPEPINMFFAYYTAQTLEENVSSVYKLMLFYLGDQDNDNVNKAKKMYRKAMRKIKRTYKDQLDQEAEEKIEYDISKSFESLEIAPYTEDTFLIPDVILNLFKKYKDRHEDLSEYKNVIEQILLNQGEFKLSDNHREYYLKNFAKLLSTNNVNMKTYTANVNTLYNVGNGIYSSDRRVLQGKLPKNKSKKRNCSSTEEYMSIYNKVSEYFESESDDEVQKSL
jgi:hypothetical protein